MDNSGSRITGCVYSECFSEILGASLEKTSLYYNFYLFYMFAIYRYFYFCLDKCWPFIPWAIITSWCFLLSSLSHAVDQNEVIAAGVLERTPCDPFFPDNVLILSLMKSTWQRTESSHYPIASKEPQSNKSEELNPVNHFMSKFGSKFNPNWALTWLQSRAIP